MPHEMSLRIGKAQAVPENGVLPYAVRERMKEGGVLPVEQPARSSTLNAVKIHGQAERLRYAAQAERLRNACVEQPLRRTTSPPLRHLVKRNAYGTLTERLLHQRGEEAEDKPRKPLGG